jgi:hypothetical protein
MGKRKSVAKPTTYCGRCGRGSYAEFCGDCQLVDPAFCAGGMTMREVNARRKARNDKERDFNETMYRIAGYRTYKQQQRVQP